MKKLIIVGAGGHGTVVADIALQLGIYEDIAFLDDCAKISQLGLDVVGKIADVDKFTADYDVFVALGNAQMRQDITEELIKKGASVPILIHPCAVISNSSVLDVGSVVMAGAIVNPCVKIGKGAIVNTCSSIDHGSCIGNYCHVSVGARIAGNVEIGDRVFFGAGAVSINNKKIASDVIVGAGAVVVNDLIEKGTYVGVPAIKIK